MGISSFAVDKVTRISHLLLLQLISQPRRYSPPSIFSPFFSGVMVLEVRIFVFRALITVVRACLGCLFRSFFAVNVFSGI